MFASGRGDVCDRVRRRLLVTRKLLWNFPAEFVRPFDYWSSRGTTGTSPSLFHFSYKDAHLHRRGNIDSTLVMVACLCLLLESHKSTKKVRFACIA